MNQETTEIVSAIKELTEEIRKIREVLEEEEPPVKEDPDNYII